MWLLFKLVNIKLSRKNIDIRIAIILVKKLLSLGEINKNFDEVTEDFIFLCSCRKIDKIIIIATMINNIKKNLYILIAY